ncbi:hypothetical protein [uncultured Phascolarctobacterium sp.]|uniref:hypothetical protein n=1 Tax=uncultured Phascolarctobacterium sp. TaxID=512296 RepID=UPI0025DCE0EA|nr:hypothetical protein [uncultured Phascolarctobacterium sp.]
MLSADIVVLVLWLVDSCIKIPDEASLIIKSFFSLISTFKSLVAKLSVSLRILKAVLLYALSRLVLIHNDSAFIFKVAAFWISKAATSELPEESLVPLSEIIFPPLKYNSPAKAAYTSP